MSAFRGVPFVPKSRACAAAHNWHTRASSAKLSTMDRKKVERISKALADETRLRIFEEISTCDGMNCGQIVSMRGVTPATVSHHLKVLAEAGLIECKRDGQFVYNKAIPHAIEDYTRELSNLTGKKAKRS